MQIDATGRSRISTNRLIASALAFSVLLLIAISMVAASGTPDPTEAANPGMVTSIVNSGVIVFREGLEAVLIFAAVTASFLGARQKYRKPVLQGVAWAAVATVLTWFLMQGVLSMFTGYEDILQVVTGLIAIGVLLLVMNWFFHKVYWTDHISGLNKKKRDLVDESESGHEMKYWGFVALGFTSVYREGFEVVLFLQNLQLKSGTAAVMWGVLLGLAGTAVVGWLTFVAHHKLPYKRMLVLTGILLGAVLVVMVGGSARAMQDVGWLSTTPLGVAFPDWWARWLELVPTVETVLMQVVAGMFVVGSYYAAEWWSREKRRRIRAEANPVEVAAAAARAHAVPGAPMHARPATPAQVRGAMYSAQPERVPTTLCGAPAVTLCGAPATEPTAVTEMNSSAPVTVPELPSFMAPSLLPPRIELKPLNLPAWAPPELPEFARGDGSMAPSGTP
jgi:high-affinity iron transporter